MEQIYSEKELFGRQGLSWGQWKLSLSNKEICDKLATIPKQDNTYKDCEHWSGLFSIIGGDSKLQQSDSDRPCLSDEIDTPMECQPIIDTSFHVQIQENIAVDDKALEKISVCLVDLCNQAALKLKHGINHVREEMSTLLTDLETLNESSILSVMDKSWTQLHSDDSKFCFCVPFLSSSKLCERLCVHILIPWLNKSLPSKLEQLSSILSTEGDTVCRHLVAPLLQIEHSPVVQDVISLEELMSSLAPKHWTTLLSVYLMGLEDLQKWQLPVLAAIVEHATPSNDDMHLLVQLMSSTGTNFAQSKDFGALLVAAANGLTADSSSVAPQLKLITNNYRGSLKFKVLKMLGDIKS